MCNTAEEETQVPLLRKCLSDGGGWTHVSYLAQKNATKEQKKWRRDFPHRVCLHQMTKKDCMEYKEPLLFCFRRKRVYTNVPLIFSKQSKTSMHERPLALHILLT
eukprot:TRINITY_DN38647_c0_g1_i2.p1 TRINITY_DN38647_c0_g1~~TRINITY_DN38647_c0_g1_i2.p1  ORF type:complete len:105 (+),score=12.64 TRINITY_DN38647_c0_g1_i2:483-797(+)